jgi:adenine-specific DNA-methyltransferase
MMYARLKVARNLLKDDGVILISIDDKEQANLKLVCDDIFGANNFIGTVVWRSSDNSNNNALTFSEDHNYILVYSKNMNWQPNFLHDESKRKHFKNPDNDPRGPWFDGNPVNNPALRPNLQFDITTPSGKIIKHPPNGWRWSKETIEEKLKTGELRFSEDESRLIRRTYLNEMKGLPPSSLCIDFEVTGHTRRAKYELKNLFPEVPVTSLFSTPKPTLLIKYLLTIASDENTIVLDFFSGSATTADAVMQKNAEDGGKRKYIMVQIPEPSENGQDEVTAQLYNICEIGKERIRRAAKKIKEETGADIDYGFRVFRVDSSNMKDVYYTPDKLKQGDMFDLASNIKEDRTGEDLLIQVMLELGLELSLPMETKQLEGKTVHYVAGNSLIACFDDNVPESVIKQIAAEHPLRVVFRDSSFEDDSARINVEELFKMLSPGTEIQVL